MEQERVREMVEFFKGVLSEGEVIAQMKYWAWMDDPSTISVIEHECVRCYCQFEIQPPVGSDHYTENLPKCPRCGQGVQKPNFGRASVRDLPPSYKFIQSGLATDLTCPLCGSEVVLRFRHSDGAPYRCCKFFKGSGSWADTCGYHEQGRWDGMEMVFTETEPCHPTISALDTPTCLSSEARQY